MNEGSVVRGWKVLGRSRFLKTGSIFANFGGGVTLILLLAGSERISIDLGASKRIDSLILGA